MSKPVRQPIASPPPTARRQRWTVAGSVLILLVVGTLAYLNSFAGQFTFDDFDSIVDNPYFKRLWPIQLAAESARPLVNLSFQLNYALGGFTLWDYHAVNLGIHLIAGLTLFGIVRRTLGRSGAMEKAATPVALAAALLWLVHPLQTESVTYIVQRAESMAGLFYLLTLYCFIRATDPSAAASGRPGAWSAAAALSCALGMACKEVMVTAPLVVWLYDRTFVAGSFREALRKRRGLYLALAASWLILTPRILLAFAPERAVSAGFGIKDCTPFEYACSQPGVILHYLRLVFWPSGLCLDYGWPVAKALGDMLPGALIVGALLAGTLWALARRTAWGVLGAWFFLILAPTSSIMPIADLAVEHRMYLPLAAVAVGAAAVVYMLLAGACARGGCPRAAGPAFALVMAAAVAGLAYRTWLRNEDYVTPVRLYAPIVAQRPDNLRARCSYGLALKAKGRFEEALAQFAEMNRRAPSEWVQMVNLGLCCDALGRYDEAMAWYSRAVAAAPNQLQTQFNLGTALSMRHDYENAVIHLTQAAKLCPVHFASQHNLAGALARCGRLDEAVDHYLQAIRLDPLAAEPHWSLGDVLERLGRYGAAAVSYREADRLRPDWPDAMEPLARLLATCPDASVRNGPQALALARRACELTQPERPEYLDTLAAALAETNHFDQAVQCIDHALQLVQGSTSGAVRAALQSHRAVYLAGHPLRQGAEPAPPATK